MWRSIVAVAAGYLSMVILVVLLFLVLGIIAPTAIPNNETVPSLGWVIFIQFFNLLAAATGGYLTALIARGSRIRHVQVLAVVVLVLGLAQLWAGMDKLPIWYLILQLAVGLVGVFLGGSLTAHRSPKFEETGP
jgi:hypothetical protein